MTYKYVPVNSIAQWGVETQWVGSYGRSPITAQTVETANSASASELTVTVCMQATADAVCSCSPRSSGSAGLALS